MIDKIPLAIPLSLHDKLKKSMVQKNFTSVEDYVIHILHEAVSVHDDEAKVKERLRGLGYLE